MPSLTHGVVSASFSISEKDTSGNFTISATISNNASTNTASPRLSISMTDSSPWQRIGPSYMTPYSTYSGSLTISTGSTSSDTVYIYLLFGSLTSGPGGGYSVAGYVDPTPEFVKRTLNISPTTQTMGKTLSISDSGGTGVTRVDHT